MSLSLSFIFSAWAEIVKQWLAGFGYKITPISEDGEWTQGSDSSNDSESEILPKMDGINTHKPKSLNNINPVKITLQTKFSFKGFPDPSHPTSNAFNHKVSGHKVVPPISLSEPVIFFSPRPVSELDAAAVKVQKVYKSYRTRRNLADCAVVVEELWWKALDFAALKRSSVSFFSVNKQETAVSRWARARTRAAKVGKGLSKDEKAQKLALQHWLEAIDPRHRYGHNLHLYYDVWFESESTQPFFFWLDVGDGKEVSLDNCPRTSLQHQCIKYLGPKERQAYEVIVENGKLVYRQSGTLVETTAGSKWIFVLSTARALYVGQKKKGTFQHSSFLSGGATTAAGRLIAHDGVLEAIWPYSGHYHPTEENFREFISFLKEHCVDLTDVKRYALDDDSPSFVLVDESKPESALDPANALECYISSKKDGPANETTAMNQRLSCKWSTGAGPRIGCVRDYPQDLQCRALEQVNLSPRIMPGTFGNYGPIPSPRPSPTVRLSPRLAYMGLPSPRTSITVTN